MFLQWFLLWEYIVSYDQLILLFLFNGFLFWGLVHPGCHKPTMTGMVYAQAICGDLGMVYGSQGLPHSFHGIFMMG